MKHFLNRTAALASMAAGAIGALAIGLAPAASAQEFSGNVTLVSDYSFRGQSQTGRDAAIQGGFDLGFDSGFYIGTWASNVNFGPYSDGADPTYTSMELDLYAGFSGEMGEGSTWDVSIIRFEYPNEGVADYIELALAFSFGDLSVGANYSPEYLGEGGDTFLYPYVGYSFGLGENATLDVSVGQGIGDTGDHLDYSITLGVPVAGLDFGIGVVGTNIDDSGPGDEGRLILSLSKSL